MNKTELLKLLEETDKWLEEDETWNEALDGYSGIDLANAVVSHIRHQIEQQLP